MDLQEGEFETQKRITIQWTFLSPQANHQRTGTPASKTATFSSQSYRFCQDPAATSKQPRTPPKNSHAPPLQEWPRTTTATAIHV
eukprot:8231394-Ditylum_brightwellii.AAC.1